MSKISVYACVALALSIVAGFAVPIHADPVSDGYSDSDDFDLQRCERECQARFGAGTLMSYGRYTGYANCMQDCNEKYRKKWDEDKQKP
jgi:hypothetical protein